MLLNEELERVDREKTPWLIVLMHVPMYSSNEAHFMEGESLRTVFEEWFLHYKVDVVFAGHVHAYERSVLFFTANFFFPFVSLSTKQIPQKDNQKMKNFEKDYQERKNFENNILFPQS